MEETKTIQRSKILAVLLSIAAGPTFGYLWVGAGRVCVLLLCLQCAALAGGALLLSFLVEVSHLLPLYEIYLGGFLIGLVALLYFWSDIYRKAAQPFSPRWYNSWYGYLLVLSGPAICGGVFAHIIRADYVEPLRFRSSSAMPTILPGELVIADKSIYRKRSIERGDMVAYKKPANSTAPYDESNVKYLHRVIGLPKEEIQIKNATVFISGNPLSEPYARWVNGGPPEGEYGPVVIPEGHYFLLGDNRDQSRDSRFWPDPFLPQKSILGKITIIYMSWHGLDRIGREVK